MLFKEALIGILMLLSIRIRVDERFIKTIKISQSTLVTFLSEFDHLRERLLKKPT